VTLELGEQLQRVQAWRAPGELGEEFIYALREAIKAIDALTAQSLARVSDIVTMPQFRALSALASPGPHRLGDLADALGVTPSTATRMCDRLVARGLVSRTRANLDRRELDLSLTAEGKRIVEATEVRRRDAVAALLAKVPEEERLVATLALRRIASSSRAGRPET
jgi:DNA-binding MarR family transcriptional regulator